MTKQKYEQIYNKRSTIFINNFIGGIAWGLGATFGVSLLIAVLGIIAGKANLVPLVGSFVSEIINFVLKNNPDL